jgi:ribosomal protein S18 acetylase RimI-like enzyme
VTTPGPDGTHGPAAEESSTPSAVVVSEVIEVDADLVEAFTRLIPQLSSSSPPPGHDQLAEIVGSDASILLVARDADGRVVGSLTLAVFRVPTGVLSWIEDVVVDERARGAGAGEALVLTAVDRARRAGAKSVDLTSRPSREAANRLYQRLGFESRSTNVYRRTLEVPAEES